MPTIREIRRRIIAVKSTQKITRAMRMVAAAKLRRGQENIVKVRPYAASLEDMVSRITSTSSVSSHPLLEIHPSGKVLLVVVNGDSGLSGGFNSNTIRAAIEYIQSNPGEQFDLYCVGEKGRVFFIRSSFNLTGQKVNFFRSLKYGDAVQIVSELISLYKKNMYSRVDIIYNQFKSAMQGIIVNKTLLPFKSEQTEGNNEIVIDYLYEPNEFELLDILIPYNLEVQIWRVLLESYATEMAAKMTAMDAATENASELIDKLTISFNRARQAIITKELSEIVSGAEGLNS
jgi:F-type H+-transporting ATPase subunit gamma